MIGPFGNGEQTTGPNPPQFRMVPARQGFGPNQAVAGAIELRLEQNLDLIPIKPLK